MTKITMAEDRVPAMEVIEKGEEGERRGKRKKKGERRGERQKEEERGRKRCVEGGE